MAKIVTGMITVRAISFPDIQAPLLPQGHTMDYAKLRGRFSHSRRNGFHPLICRSEQKRGGSPKGTARLRARFGILDSRR